MTTGRAMHTGRAAERGLAFSLVELMVSLGVLSILLALVFEVFNGALKSWQRAERTTDVFREARAALTLLTRDLSNAIAAPGMTNLEIGASVFPTPEGGGLHPQLHVLTARRDKDGNVRGAGYYCHWDSGRGGFMLKRIFEAGTRTFDRLRGVEPFRFEASGLDVGAEETLAPFVWDLKLRAYTNATECTEAAAFCGSLPLWMEVEFQALSSAAAARIRAARVTRADWLDPASEKYRTHILPNARRFASRIPMGAR